MRPPHRESLVLQRVRLLTEAEPVLASQPVSVSAQFPPAM